MSDKILHQPCLISKPIEKFIGLLNHRYGLKFESYEDLHRWSVEHIEKFWAEFWGFSGVIAGREYESVLQRAEDFTESRWFTGAGINFAENLLRYNDECTALIAENEVDEPRFLTYRQLNEQSAALAAFMRERGIGPGSVVAAYLPNIPETVITMLAATACGAAFTSTSPDFGPAAVLDRFRQVQPAMLFLADGYYYKEKLNDLADKNREIMSELKSTETVSVNYTGSGFTAADDFHEIIEKYSGADAFFKQISFSDPVYIMYSSGTTGLPKSIVQGPGVLLNQNKEHILHCSITRDDTVFYFTTTGWMMWNWLVASLATGARLVLYDGNPAYPGVSRLWQMAETHEISVFGTSARYIEALEAAGFQPDNSRLQKLRLLLSTGSVLTPESFDYIYRVFSNDLHLASISGGTDLNGCFVLGNPMKPVRRGEIQAAGLGMDVAVFNEEGRPVREEKGELVCRQPFPSMPLHFVNDADGERYRRAYFNRFENIWCHGDFAEETAEGGFIIYGRSDATLNPAGVRIGSAEIYRVIEQIPGVLDSIVAGIKVNSEEKICLFIVTGQGAGDNLEELIKDRIRSAASPRHVPAFIARVSAVPVTLNGKKSEIAVKKLIEEGSVTNRSALADTEVLEEFRALRGQILSL